MLLKSMPEVLCPWCLEIGGLYITSKLKAKPLDSYSLAGGQLKFNVRELPVLKCNACGNETFGEWDGPGYAVFPDPHA